MTQLTFPEHYLHHEDLEVGATRTFGSRLITKEEIVAFARQFDPQPMHLDEEAAKSTLVGGLCASGFHTCALLMRILCDDMILSSASLGSPGVDEVRWLKPVRPGDVLSARSTCTEKRASASRPSVGLSKITFELLNAAGEIVAIWKSNQIMALRHPPTASGPSPQLPPVAAAAVKVAKPKLASLWDVVDAPAPSTTGNFFEDRVVGEMTDLGSHTFSRDEIIAFATDFDPQPFHLNEAAGAKSLFGGLSASGWHTASVYVRKVVDARHAIESAITKAGGTLAEWGPSPGFKECLWFKPVLVGDTLSFRSRTTALVPSQSRPDRGLIVSESQGRNQKGEIAFAITGQIFVQRRTRAVSSG
jgi:acyl dehydratase